MPVIGIPVGELTRCLGREIERGRLRRILEEIGCDVEGYETLSRARCAACGLVFEMVGKEEAPPRCDRCDADLRSSPASLQAMPGIEVIRMELLAVRPDLFDPGGLARALRGILDLETGLPSYPVGPPALRLRVDDTVRGPRSSRSYIVCAVLENVTLDEDRIKVLMKLQENLHWALGRDRKHASIGVYDLDSLSLSADAGGAAALEYTTEDPAGYDFVPLGAPGVGPEHRCTLRQILEEHPKGMAYAHLLAGFDRYPILRTRDGLVLSMPPIINSEQTKVHLGSRRLFIDVTGTGRRVVQRTLNILVTSLLELDPSARLSAVRIENATAAGATIADSGAPPAGTREEITPDLTPQTAWIDRGHTERILGLSLDPEQLSQLLRRMRHGVVGQEGDRLRVQVAAYRSDILHERDLMEDAAVAYGYTRIPRTLVPSQTIGRQRELERRSEAARDVLLGLGFVEIVGLVLTSPEQSDLLLDLGPHPATVLLDNPISGEQTQLRTSLLPGLLTTLAHNRHNPLPQGIFEVGDVTLLDPEAETGARELRHLAFALISPKSGFAEARALTEAVVREFGWPLRLEPAEPGFLLEGRGAQVLAPSTEGNEPSLVAGVMGEVHPRVLERLGLQNPAVVCELALPPAERPSASSARG